MSKQESSPAHQEHVVLGMTAAMGAFFSFTVMNMFAKLLSANHSVIEIAFYRNLIASVPFLIMVFAFGRREILVLRSKPTLVGLRAVLGTVISIVLAMVLEDIVMVGTLGLVATIVLILVGVIFGHSFDWRAEVIDEIKDR